MSPSTSNPVPSFDEWVDYCFTQGYQDFHRDFAAPDVDVVESRIDRFLNFDPSVLAEYVIRLFESPEKIADRYSHDKIADAIWFIFGVGSEYFHDVRSETVEFETQIKCMRSVESFYLRLLDRVCCLEGKDPEGEHTNELKVDVAVFMIWDMDCIEIGVMFPDDFPYLKDAGLQVLENVLMKCRTSSCITSALHGLGHLLSYHPKECERIIDRFLKERKSPGWIRDYALNARTGYIQ